MDDEKLIELVRDHQVLYDLSSPYYSDASHKMQKWQEIGEILKQGGLAVCWWRAGYGACLALILLGFLAYRLAIIQEAGPEQEGNEWKINLMKVVVNCGASAITLAASVTGLKEIGHSLEALRSSEINDLAYSPKISLNFLFTLMIFALIGLDCLVYNEMWLTFLQLIWGFYLSSLVNTASVDFFVGYISVLKDAYYEIQQWILDPHKPKLEAAIFSFEKITTAAEHHNEAFGIQLLVIVGANFLISTSNAFLIVSEDNIMKKILFICWCGASASFPLRIVYAIDHLLQQRNEVNNTLNTLLVRGHVFSGPSESGKVKLHVAMKKELEFTASGFFTLDYGMINSMLGAVTTYLVILMQFNQ